MVYDTTQKSLLLQAHLFFCNCNYLLFILGNAVSPFGRYGFSNFAGLSQFGRDIPLGAPIPSLHHDPWRRLVRFFKWFLLSFSSLLYTSNLLCWSIY